jgi:hypothetical protein
MTHATQARRRCADWLGLAAFILAGSPAGGRELFVDRNHAGAENQNPGTEAQPFKTIQGGVDAAQPGDTIWVKAGIYEEPVKINKAGEYNAPITLSAWRDDRVQIGFVPRPLPAAGKWEPLPDSKCFQVKLTNALPDDCVIVLNDLPVITVKRDKPPRDDKVNWACYRKSNETLMFNANGKDPATLGEPRYGRANPGAPEFWLDQKTAWWIIRRLQFSWLPNGIHLCADNCIVEDCFFTRCYRVGVFLHGRTDIVRRCNFYRCGTAIAGSGVGPAHILEDNLIVECGFPAEADIMIGNVSDPENYQGEAGMGPTCFKGNMLSMIFAYNILADNTSGAAWYADIDGKGTRIVGNAFWNNTGGGIYNEYGIDDSLIIGNAFHKSPLTSAMCTRLTVTENYFFEAGTAWYSRDWWMFRDSYMTLRKNAFLNPTYGYLLNCGNGAGGITLSQRGFANCWVDFNRIWAASEAVLLNDNGAGKTYRAFEDIRKDYGFELHGEIKPYSNVTPEQAVAAMGGSLVTFRIPWGKRSGEARPMLGNADFECRWPAAPDMLDICTSPAFFWRMADGNYDSMPLWGTFDPHHEYLSRWHARSMSGYYDKGENAGCRWYVEAEPQYPPDAQGRMPKGTDLKQWPTVTTLSEGNHWVGIGGVTPAKMPPQGVGYWSPYLGAAPGAKTTVSFKMRGMGVQPTANGTPSVWMQFTDETGQNRKRVFIVGQDDQGVMHHPELTQGEYDWTNVEATVIAPEGAVRMALFLGVRPCKGDVGFDDVNIRTASDAGPAAANEIVASRLPQAKFREVFYVDLLAAANRALADDADNDGQGGWSDQGPTADMRELKPGERRFGGVPFRILEPPKSVVALKSSNRSRGNLPEKVVIPVGRKADDLFFLHSAAWFKGFTYIVHYADGKDLTLSVDAKNMVDWIASPVGRFPMEDGTFSTVAETVKVPMFQQGSIYRMEWSAPLDRRGIEIQSIEFVGDGETVPILLGITGVTEW